MITEEPCPVCGIKATVTHGEIVNGRPAHTWDCRVCGPRVGVLCYVCPDCEKVRQSAQEGRAEVERQDDAEIIRAFQWADDDAPLPVDTDDPDEVSAALRWATNEYRRYDGEYFSAVSEEGWEPGATEMLRSDRDALGRFKAALMRTLHAMRERDRDLLAAWTMGEPIHGGECTAKQAQEGPSAPLRRTDMLGAEA